MEYLGNKKEINLITPLVSVCVPTYSHEKFIRSCLESIIFQKTSFTYEILIGEDDSPDRTREICMDIAQIHQDKIRLFLRKDSEKIKLFGKTAGRGNQLGLYREARGEFICFCDGDDIWNDSFKLQKQVDALKKNPQASMSITNSYVEKNQNKAYLELPQEQKIFTKKSLRKKFYLGHISSWMVRNYMDELLKNEIVKKRIPLDKILFSFYKSKGEVVFLPDVTSTYRFNSSGIYLSQAGKNNFEERFSHNWYLFKYIHHDISLYFRTIGYEAKRMIVNSIKKL